MEVTMPQLGESVTEGTITKWFKAIGEKVEADEPLFEVSTDKVDSEVPSPVSGFLTQILAQEGDTVDVGAAIAVVEDSPGVAAPATSSAPEPAAEPVPVAPEPPVVQAEPVTPAMPEPEPSSTSPSAAASEVAPAPTSAEPVASSASQGAGPSSGLVLSPVVRQLLRENNVDAAEVVGTGVGGRVTREDVLDFLDQRARSVAAPQAAPAPGAPALAPTPSSPAPASVSATLASSLDEPGGMTGDKVVAFSNIRKLTAEHMVRSKATSPHAACVVEVDFSGVDAVRREYKQAFEEQEGSKLTFLPFIATATVDALREFPEVNASVEGNSLLVHSRINLGIAVDLEFKGLIAPVIQEADSLRLRAMAKTISSLADRARSKRLGPDEIVGGTFTITNNGGFGSVLTIPIINQPQVAILSTDAIRKVPVAVTLPDGTDVVAIRPVGRMVLCWDHRAFDGAYAASFVSKVKEFLETRNWAAEM